jgi:hypothetical protein
MSSTENNMLYYATLSALNYSSKLPKVIVMLSNNII